LSLIGQMNSKAHKYVRLEKFSRGLRGLVLAVIVFVLGWAGYHLFEFQEPKKTVIESTLDVGDGLKTKISGFKMREKSSNKDLWVLNSGLASMANDEIEMDNVKVGFVSGTKATGSFELSAIKAVMDNRTQNAVFSGDVTITTAKPATVKTDRLDWNTDKRTISTDLPVKVWMDFGSVTGSGLIMNMEKQSLSLNSNVKASLNRGILRGK
jgi:LPS export ABC transporter protein LptC